MRFGQKMLWVLALTGMLSGTSAFAADNPFEQACLIAKHGGTVKTVQNQPDCFVGSPAALQYRYDLPDDPDFAENTLQSLLQAFGPETSIRRNIHVWDIAAPTTNPSQADIVTILMIYNPAGTSTLIMDRARGGVTVARGTRSEPTAKSKKSKPSEQDNRALPPTKPEFDF